MPTGPALRIGTVRHPLFRPVLVVGRKAGDWRTAPDVDLGPIDRQRVVSRRHAQLDCDASSVYLRDLGSTNGTLVNGELVAKGSVVRLRDGDAVNFGGVQATFEANGAWPEALGALWGDGRNRPEATLPGPRTPR